MGVCGESKVGVREGRGRWLQACSDAYSHLQASLEAYIHLPQEIIERARTGLYRPLLSPRYDLYERPGL